MNFTVIAALQQYNLSKFEKSSVQASDYHDLDLAVATRTRRSTRTPECFTQPEYYYSLLLPIRVSKYPTVLLSPNSSSGRCMRIRHYYYKITFDTSLRFASLLVLLRFRLASFFSDEDFSRCVRWNNDDDAFMLL